MPPADVVEAWRSLAVAAENPFALPEWHEAWCAAHPADRPRILVCRRGDGSVAGVLPLVVRGDGRRRVVLAAGDALVDVLPAACAAADARAVAETVARELPRGRGELWRLERVPAGSPWPAAVAAAGRTRVRWRDEPPLVVADLRDAGALMDGRQRRERRAAAPPARRRARGHRPHQRRGAGGAPRPRGAAAAARGALGRGRLPADGPGVPRRLRRPRRRARLAAPPHARGGRPARRGALRLAARAHARSRTRRRSTPPMRATPSASRCWRRRSSAPPPRAAPTTTCCAAKSATSSASASRTHPLESHLVARRGSPAAVEALARSAARTAWARLPAGGRARLGRLRAR